MRLWGTVIAVYVCFLALRAAEPPLDPTPVCSAAADWKAFEGKTVALLGRYSFRENGPQKGRWLDQEACGGKSERALVHLSSDTQSAPKPPERVALDERSLESKLAEIRRGTALGKFRFGSPDYDRWAVVIGKLRKEEGRNLELVYRGDGAVFFLADR